MSARHVAFLSPEEAQQYIKEFLERHNLSVPELKQCLYEEGLWTMGQATLYRYLNKGQGGWRIQLLATCLMLLEERGRTRRKAEVAA